MLYESLYELVVVTGHGIHTRGSIVDLCPSAPCKRVSIWVCLYERESGAGGRRKVGGGTLAGTSGIKPLGALECIGDSVGVIGICK